MRRTLLSLGFLAAFVGVAAAQNFVAPPVQQSATKADAATLVSTLTNTATAAVLTSASTFTNIQTTATLTPPGGQFVYITEISFDVCTNGTGTAANNLSFSSTGITGLPFWQISIAATASICQHWSESFSTPLKSTAAGTAVTVVSPAAATNNGYVSRIYGYFAP